MAFVNFLLPLFFIIAQTDRAFTGKYTYAEGPAIYHCAICHLPLFHGDDQYDSGSGYPSFKQGKNVYFLEDWSLGFKRYEVLCKGCDSHLGHIFNDGPPPKHLRYCIHSTTLVRVE